MRTLRIDTDMLGRQIDLLVRHLDCDYLEQVSVDELDGLLCFLGEVEVGLHKGDILLELADSDEDAGNIAVPERRV